MTFNRVIRDSGLTKTEIAELYETSRQTVHRWIAAGHTGRGGSLVARQAEVITQALVQSIERGLLPMRAMDKDLRRARITRMARALHNLKPAPK
jgi:hypothetical protein